MYFFLIAIVFVFLIFNLILNKFEVLNPSVVMSLMFLFCAILGVLRYSDWEMQSYSGISVALLSLGILAFSLGGLFARLAGPNLPSTAETIRHERLELSSAYIVTAVVIGILGNVLFFKYILNLVGGENLTSILYNYYIARTRLQNLGDNAIPTMTNILVRIIEVNSVFTLYVLIHNICFRKLKIRDWWHVVIVSFWPIQCILKSGRGDILVLLAEAVYLLYFFWNMYYGWGGRVNSKIIYLGGRILVIFLAIFVVLAVATGRRDSFAELDIKDYLTKYMCVGIRNFDLYIQNPVEREFAGKETFTAIFRILYNYFGIGGVYANTLEFRTIGQYSAGNIYTAFRRYYADFGISGLAVISGLLGFFYSKIYENCKRKCYHDQAGFIILLFAYLSKEIFYLQIEEYFFLSVTSISGIFKIILLYFLYYYYIQKKFVVKFGKYSL